MKTALCVAFCVLCSLFAPNRTAARELSSLKLLYVGDKGSDREQAFTSLLQRYVAAITAVNRVGFDPAAAASYDVVLLDWPQDPTVIVRRHWGSFVVSPLGPRETWAKPTVLLGSAGLNLAVTWQIKGGVGCTCLQPLAYNFHDHEIFKT